MDSKRCVTIDEISPIDASISHSGVRRCRDTELTTSGSGKRSKFSLRDQDIVLQSENQLRSAFDVNSPSDVVSSPECGTCDHILSSPCFTNCLNIDLKVELRVETEIETETSLCGIDGFREMSQSTDSHKPETISTMKPKAEPPQAVASHRKPATAAKTPTAAEIEEFFSAAEKEEQKRFSEKYNFDIVNDVPMDGRYQWVRLTP